MSFFGDLDFDDNDEVLSFFPPGVHDYSDNSYDPFSSNDLFNQILTDDNFNSDLFNGISTGDTDDISDFFSTDGDDDGEGFNFLGEYINDLSDASNATTNGTDYGSSYTGFSQIDFFIEDNGFDLFGGYENYIADIFNNSIDSYEDYNLFPGFPTVDIPITGEEGRMFFPDSFLRPSRFSGSSFLVPIYLNRFRDNMDTSSFSNFTNTSVIRYVRRICGFPAFCNNSALDVCSNTTIVTECSECNTGLAALFATACVVLGLLILIGNSLVIWSVVKEKVKSKRNKIKASLAFADIFTAINLLVVVVYNFAWTISSSPNFIETTHLSLTGSVQAIVGGIFFMLGFTASLYHLVFLGLQRFYAIMWPIRYKQQRARWFNLGMVLVWLFSVTTATAPLWFKGHATFAYFSVVFLYLPSPELFDFENKISITSSTVITIAFTLVPYLVMTVLTFATAVLIHFRFKKSKAVTGNTKSTHKKEVSAFKTVALMQLGFTLTLAPLIIAQILFLLDFFRCDEIAVPFTICVYITMSNSLVNVLIYSARDKEFKDKVKEIFTSTKSTLGIGPIISPPNSKKSVVAVISPSKTSETKSKV